MSVSRQIKSEMQRRLIAQDKALKEELQAVAEQYSIEVRGKHEAVVRDWTHRPPFKSSVYVSKRQVQAQVWPAGKNAKFYKWVDRGTKEHDILPKKFNYLKFQTGYSTRTATAAKFNVGNGRKFGAWRSIRVVHHPGTKARRFSEIFREDVLPAFRKDVENAMRRALRKAS